MHLKVLQTLKKGRFFFFFPRLRMAFHSKLQPASATQSGQKLDGGRGTKAIDLKPKQETTNLCIDGTI